MEDYPENKVAKKAVAVKHWCPECWNVVIVLVDSDIINSSYICANDGFEMKADIIFRGVDKDK